MPTPEELIRLLVQPNESLSIEYKSWLDLSNNAGKATLAKAAIALANHDGGIIVLGMREDNAEGGVLGSQPRPDELRRYSQDDVNGAINRYADPAFHCELLFAEHPYTNTEHAFISVPGGMTVPIMSSRDSNGVIRSQRCYIRKPGPRSEEPFTNEEWRTLMHKCVTASREDLLDSVRMIVLGYAGGIPRDENLDELVEFIAESQQRWENLIEPLAVNDAARMRHGSYELSFRILNVTPAPTMGELRIRLNNAGAIKYTGWSPFVRLNRTPLEPRIAGGTIEAWLGAPNEDAIFRDSAHSDFWRAHPDGRLFQIRGYDEDATLGVEPGTCIDITLPIWRVGEVMLYVARLARLYDANPTIIVRCRYTGLRNRILGHTGRHRRMFENRICADDEAFLETEATATEIDENLPEIFIHFWPPSMNDFHSLN